MISSTTAKVQFTLSSGDQSLAIPFYFLENSHVKVVRTRNGVDTTLSATGYSLTGAGAEAGGTCVLTGLESAGGDRLTILRNVPASQLVDYAPNDRFPASTHERALDKLTMLGQRFLELAERALRFGEGEVIGSGNVLPNAITRADKILAFDDDGALDLSLGLDDVRTIVIANPVAALSDVTDYGSVGDPVTDVADYGSIA